MPQWKSQSISEQCNKIIKCDSVKTIKYILHYRYWSPLRTFSLQSKNVAFVNKNARDIKVTSVLVMWSDTQYSVAKYDDEY